MSAGIPATLPTVSGEDITLRIGHVRLTIDERTTRAVGINGMVPGPLVRLREGQIVRLHVVNTLSDHSVLHPHAMMVPENQLGSGLDDFEMGLWLRYERRRDLAPYLGVSCQRDFGATRRSPEPLATIPESFTFVLGCVLGSRRPCY